MRDIITWMLASVAAVGMLGCERPEEGELATTPAPDIRPEADPAPEVRVVTKTEYVEVPDPKQSQRIDGLMVELENQDRVILTLETRVTAIRAQRDEYALQLDHIIALQSIAEKVGKSRLNCDHFSSSASAQKFHRLVDPFDQQRLDGHSLGKLGTVCESLSGTFAGEPNVLQCQDFRNQEALVHFQDTYAPFQDLLKDRVDPTLWTQNACPF